MSNDMIILDLPWPPSVNTYYRSPTMGRPGARTMLSRDARIYRIQVGSLVSRYQIEGLRGKVSVHVDVFPPDARKRDLDNLCKGILDGLCHAGVYEDDGDIDRLSLERKAVTPGGLVRVFISPHRG